MHLEHLDELDHDGLLEYVRTLLWQFRVMDAFWFINVEREYGLAAAEQLNERVWGKVAELAARDIVKRFGPFPGGTEGFLAAHRFLPWHAMVDYRYEQGGEGELFIGVDRCPAQAGRLRHGHGEYSCRDMHRAEFQSFATVIDPALKVECIFAPHGERPEETHPEDQHCRWRIFSA